MEIKYTSKGPVSRSQPKYFRTTLLMVRELIESRELVWSFFVREFSAKYKQSVLGIAWAFILPILTVGMFIILNTSGVLNIPGLEVPYVAYALVGLMAWHLFSAVLTNATSSMVSAGGMIAKINFQKSSLVIASSAIGVVEFLIRLPLIIAVFVYYRIPVDFSNMVLGGLAIVPLCFLAVGIGFVFSLLAGVFRDIVIVLPVVLNALMLLTPIMYPVSKDSLLGKINLWNPVNYLVNTGRDILFHGQSVHLGYWISVIVVLIIFTGSWRFFQLAQPRIAERI